VTSPERGEKIVFWLATISTEIVLYLMILLGVSIMFYGVFRTIHLPSIAILSAIIESFSVWRKHEQEVYVESYKKHVLQEDRK